MYLVKSRVNKIQMRVSSMERRQGDVTAGEGRVADIIKTTMTGLSDGSNVMYGSNVWVEGHL